MKKATLQAVEEEAIMLTIEIDGDIAIYAEIFLTLFNNVREHEDLLKIENSYDNCIYLYCEPSAVDEVEDWLLARFEEYITIVDHEWVAVYYMQQPKYSDKYIDCIYVKE